MPSVTTSQLQNTSGVWKTTTATMDAMGHVVQTQTTDPAGPDYVDTKYDGEGHIYQQSNPTRCASSPGTLPSSCSESTYGVTTYTYDALGRTIQQAQPDGVNSLYWCYDGLSGSGCSANASATNKSDGWVDAHDENGNHTQRTYDAFGDLVTVMEPGPANGVPDLLCRWKS